MKKIILSLILAFVSVSSFANNEPYDPCGDLNVLAVVKEDVIKTKYWYDKELIGYDKGYIKRGKTLMELSTPNTVLCQFRVVYIGRKNRPKEMNFGVGLKYNRQDGKVSTFQANVSNRVELKIRDNK
ncbi:hypothetical protein OND84_000487 [Morganella morganii]|uniref:hypothetical protein n=1 Tax=Morganella morganii TaxID=582 RepID=UPI002ADEA2BE|nr:hypothetical protein [Morganella morganii]